MVVNEGAMPYEVGAVARLSGVTVRTLHHYDQIGLLRPSDRTPAGYRRYDERDLERLQRILFYDRARSRIGRCAGPTSSPGPQGNGRQALPSRVARPAMRAPRPTNTKLTSVTSCFTIRFVGRFWKTVFSWPALSAG
jgi:hypothetical protein